MNYSSNSITNNLRLLFWKRLTQSRSGHPWNSMLISKFSEIRHVFLDYLSVSYNNDNTNKKKWKSKCGHCRNYWSKFERCGKKFESNNHSFMSKCINIKNQFQKNPVLIIEVVILSQLSNLKINQLWGTTRKFGSRGRIRRCQSEIYCNSHWSNSFTDRRPRRCFKQNLQTKDQCKLLFFLFGFPFTNIHDS